MNFPIGRLSPLAPILVLLLGVLVPVGAGGTPAVTTQRVLVLYSYNRLVPGNVEMDRGLREVLVGNVQRPFRTSSEFLDSPEFIGSAYEALMVAYLHGKYVNSAPAIMVVFSDEALKFVLAHRGELFPGVPIVHAAVSPALLHSITDLPIDVVGVPLEYDYLGTIAQALHWHPRALRLVIVTGASPTDHEHETLVRTALQSIAIRPPVEFWSGLRVADLKAHLSRLGADSVVFTPGFLQDGDGRQFSPYDAAVIVAGASGAPVYGPFDTFIGVGIVGGRMPSFHDVGTQAGHTVQQLLSGTAPADLRLPLATPIELHVDWRQAQRWGIGAERFPANTVVHFRKPTLWEGYRTQVLIALGVILLQSILVLMFYIERRRVRAAESTSQKLHTELAHLSRVAVAGELTASIAHEINQPLAAIQTGADAADLLMRSVKDLPADVLGIVNRIRLDTLRATNVIRRLRSLLARSEPDPRPFDAALALTEVALILRPEAERRDIILNMRGTSAAVYALGDQTQTQQVLINLIVNAMDAVAKLPEERRRVEVQVESSVGKILFTVRDRGHGIAAENLPRLFDSFFSTKQQGMGLGLSIARSIVERYRGRLWAENNDRDGATFFVEMPAAGASAPAAA